MAPLRGSILLALLCIFCVVKSNPEQCSEPEWGIQSMANPIASRRGKVVLVAMLKGYCGYCVIQAGRLNTMKAQLAENGYPNIDILIINGGENASRDNIANLVNASPLPVIQDLPNHVMYREVFQANKDDFVVYDKCGQAAMYIPHPYSDLRYEITARVLIGVHEGRHSCYCSLDAPSRDPDDVMAADDPGVAGGQLSAAGGLHRSNLLARNSGFGGRGGRGDRGGLGRSHHRHPGARHVTPDALRRLRIAYRVGLEINADANLGESVRSYMFNYRRFNRRYGSSPNRSGSRAGAP